MKLNRLLLTMASLTALANVAPLTDVYQPTTTVYAQEETAAIDVEGLKEELSHYVPVNPEMLDDISDEALTAYYNEAQAVDYTETQTHLWKYIYDLIVENHPEGNWITGEDYDAYFRVVEAVSARTGHTLSELNKVGPAQLLQSYRQAMAEHDNNVDEAVAAVQPEIEQAIRDYDQRQADKIVVDDADQALTTLKTDLIEKTPLSQEQLDQVSDDTLVAYQEVAADQEQPYMRVYNLIVEDYPELFEDQVEIIANQWQTELGIDPEEVKEKVSMTNILWTDYFKHQSDSGGEYDILKELAGYGVTIPEDGSASSESESTPSESESTEPAFTAETLSDYLISDTPVTVQQAEQLDIDALVPFANQALVDSETMAEDIFNHTYETQTDVFVPEVNRIRETLVDNQLVDGASLNTVSDPELLLEEYKVWQENGGNENFDQLAQTLIANYAVQPTSQETGSNEESTSESEVQTSNSVESTSQTVAGSESANTELTPGASISNVSTESSEQSQHVTVTSSADTEEAQDSLPKTGESSSWWLIAIAVVIALVSVYLIYTGRKTRHDDEDELR